jgi:hypothetical protein
MIASFSTNNGLKTVHLAANNNNHTCCTIRDMGVFQSRKKQHFSLRQTIEEKRQLMILHCYN